MKKRAGFVSNSSASSFVIYLDTITAKQLIQIQNHIEEGRKLDVYYNEAHDAWDIRVDKECVEGYTSMDNFDMCEFLEKIGVPENAVDWWHS